jgi:4-hydroxybenzoate polyprenyltransferase
MPRFKNYLSLIKFSHTLFALPFAMIGFFLGIFGWKNYNPIVWKNNIYDADYSEATVLLIRFFLVLICMISARSAAMAFNRYLDRHFDARNPRTAIREIPRGIISPNSAIRLVAFCCFVFMVTCWFINRICFYLSPVALFVILFYSYTKRFTSLCHIILGIGLSLAPIGAFLAVTGRFELLPLLFSGAVICWVGGFDIIYAMQDVDFDTSEKLFSIPTALGKIRALRIAIFLHIVSAIFVISSGLLGSFGTWYWMGVLLFASMLVYQHTIVKPNDLSRVNIAFMTANGIASVVFALFVITDMFIAHKH